MISGSIVVSTMIAVFFTLIMPTVIVYSATRKFNCIISNVVRGIILFLLVQVFVLVYSLVIRHYFDFSNDSSLLFIIKVTFVSIGITLIEIGTKFFMYRRAVEKDNSLRTVIEYACGYGYMVIITKLSLSSTKIFMAILNIKLGNVDYFKNILTNTLSYHDITLMFEALNYKYLLIVGFQAVICIMYEFITTLIIFNYFKKHRREHLILVLLMSILYNTILNFLLSRYLTVAFVGLVIEMIVLAVVSKRIIKNVGSDNSGIKQEFQMGQQH